MATFVISTDSGVDEQEFVASLYRRKGVINVSVRDEQHRPALDESIADAKAGRIIRASSVDELMCKLEQ